MGAQSDFISEQFVPSERHKAQQRAMAETLSAAALNLGEFDSLSTPEETARMAKRNLGIVRETPLLGVCEYCNAQFSSGLMPVEAAKADIQERFNVHKCERQDIAQNARRIVREATEKS